MRKFVDAWLRTKQMQVMVRWSGRTRDRVKPRK